jgi:hypothetical protein
MTKASRGMDLEGISSALRRKTIFGFVEAISMLAGTNPISKAAGREAI